MLNMLNAQQPSDELPYKEISLKKLNLYQSKSNEDYFYFKNFQYIKTGNTKKILGKGAFAEVCLVKSKIDGGSYAMKIIEKKKVDSISDIKEEIRIHLSLNHVNIIKLYSFSETAEFFYLIMEYASKGNLFYEIKNQNTFNERKCRDYFAQTIKGVQYLHSLGFVHRDIKPENLLLSKDWTVKICDFGGCVKIEDGQIRKTFYGTYEYMAPEVIEGSNYDRSVDIWALGILLYELLHGNSPYRVIDKSENVKEYKQIYDNIIGTDELTIKDDLSDEAAHLIKNLLIRDKAKRIKASEILNHPWVRGKKIPNKEKAMDISYLHNNNNDSFIDANILNKTQDKLDVIKEHEEARSSKKKSTEPKKLTIIEKSKTSQFYLSNSNTKSKQQKQKDFKQSNSLLDNSNNLINNIENEVNDKYSMFFSSNGQDSKNPVLNKVKKKLQTIQIKREINKSSILLDNQNDLTDNTQVMRRNEQDTCKSSISGFFSSFAQENFALDILEKAQSQRSTLNETVNERKGFFSFFTSMLSCTCSNRKEIY